MVLRCRWALLTAWLCLVYTASGQFNDTFRVTITSNDPMTDMDNVGDPRDPITYNWKVDELSGFRKSSGAGGYMLCRFVATGYDAHGVAWWTSQVDQISANNSLRYQNLPEARGPNSDALQTVEVGAKNGTYLGSMSGLELAAYELVVSHENLTEVTFHNMSLQVPIRSQA